MDGSASAQYSLSVRGSNELSDKLNSGYKYCKFI